MTIELIEGDITALDVDCIVNAANSTLLGGGGVDGAIHRAAGPQLLAECRQVRSTHGPCDTGDAVITGAGRLAARHVIHTVGPIWADHDPAEADRLLGSCYRRSLDLAESVQATSIAFPNVSTGVYGFPKDRACEVAIAAVTERIATSPVEVVVFCCFDAENVGLYRARLG